MFSVDLNCDLGESYGLFRIGNDQEVLKHITSANIACGYHAGDHNVMMETVKMAKVFGVKIGAHPGFPDLHGFGRREMKISADEIYNLTIYQIGALVAIAKTCGTKVVHVKPHGALYNMAAKDKEIADAIAGAVADTDPTFILFGLAGSCLVKAGEEKGLQVAHEVFADRTYQPDGSLTPRSETNAIIHDPSLAIKRVVRMVREGRIEAVDGTEIEIKADTICIHGDEPQALDFAVRLNEALKTEGIEVGRGWDSL
ncbi:LamB/YcsF family protein [Mesobacillus selenatarsenatis]|uniref:5-oxoprolinase subunit A n=1 Tax=Mesobacillus selenatarsenatis (strain DSM 18680 / JCM 14380 / FERM P-15431 / SF-1) TaxID=1321606 RepID=A0A0A8X4A6_MESS1|nr:5-oxoprolinase subunit PxpA [Mesobacillus selenatarsenatis]GAM14104.1 lactam utilization protein LamB [Mesobacillus selenatarsenatis SF-1]